MKRIILLLFAVVAINRCYGQYDIAAYIWPAFHDDPRWHELGIFPDGKGEWESIYNAKPRFEGHRQPRVPLWGYLDEADVSVQEKIIKTATKYGVNTFIFDWYWYDDKPFLEAPLNAFVKARNSEKMKFYLMWANHTATNYWDRNAKEKNKVYWRGEVTKEIFDGFTDHIIRDYFLRPNYYKIDGQPVFAIYELRTFIDGMGGLENAKKALDGFNKKCIAAGLPGVHLQAILFKIPESSPDGVSAPSQNSTLEYLGFKSMTSYQWCHYVPANTDYEEWGDKAISKLNDLTGKFTIPYFTHVSVDWDNNPRFVDRQNAVTGVSPEKFKKFLKIAKAYVDSHPNQVPLISVNAWNEWSEGSYLEPDTEFGYQFLEAIRDEFKKR